MNRAERADDRECRAGGEMLDSAHQKFPPSKRPARRFGQRSGTPSGKTYRKRRRCSSAWLVEAKCPAPHHFFQNSSRQGLSLDSRPTFEKRTSRKNGSF